MTTAAADDDSDDGHRTNKEWSLGREDNDTTGGLNNRPFAAT